MTGAKAGLAARVRSLPVGLLVALVLFAALSGLTVVRTLRAGFTPTYDEANYEAMVKTWLNTGVYGYYAPTTHQPDSTVTPGFPLFLAPFYALSGDARQATGGPYAAIFGAQVLLGLLAVWATWRLADGIAGRRAAAIAATALAVYPAFYRLQARLLTETLSASAFMLFLVVATGSVRGSSWRRSLGAGALATVAVMTRPSFGPMVLVVLACLAVSAVDKRAAWGQAAAAASVLAVALALWMGTNQVAVGRPELMSSQRGDPILAGIDPWYRESGGTYRYGPSYARFKANPPKGVSMTTYAIEQARTEFVRDPLRSIAWFTVGKTDYVFFRSASEFGRLSPMLASVWSVYHYLFVVLGFAGLALAVRVPGLRAPAAAFVAGWASLMAIQPEPRYAFGLFPLLAIGAAVLLVRAWGAAARGDVALSRDAAGAV